MPHALLVENDEKFLEPLAELATRQGFSSRCARTLDEARSALREGPADVMLLDTTLPDGSGLELLQDTPEDVGEVIVMGDAPDVDAVLEALRSRVRDYITKPVDLARIQTHLEVLSQHCHDGAAVHEGGERARYGPMLGNSEPMRALYHMIARVAPTSATVLLVGESGTGKELIAQTLHDRSDRRKAPLVPLNCGAIPENLIESELFGHEKGAFTGASQVRRGVFERASGGTLLLDEITEMPADLQVRLLRVLETDQVTRVGGEKEIPVNVRVVAATNRDPHQAVAEGKLREDLLYRLSVFPIDVPPLRDRGDDIELLAHHFLGQLNKEARLRKRLAPAALRQLRTYPWPGNVRQLKNVVHRAFIMADEVIEAAALPQSLTPTPACNGDGRGLCFSVGTSMAEVERQLIEATLREYSGDKRRTAKTLGVSLKTLYNRLNAYKTEGNPVEA